MEAKRLKSFSNYFILLPKEIFQLILLYAPIPTVILLLSTAKRMRKLDFALAPLLDQLSRIEPIFTGRIILHRPLNDAAYYTYLELFKLFDPRPGNQPLYTTLNEDAYQGNLLMLLSGLERKSSRFPLQVLKFRFMLRKMIEAYQYILENEEYPNFHHTNLNRDIKMFCFSTDETFWQLIWNCLHFWQRSLRGAQ